MARSNIEWTDRTINVFRGCTRVSAGCRNCYAERLAARFGSDEGNPYEGFSRFVDTKDGKEPRWTGKVEVIEKMMEAPLNIKKPSLIFINSMSDTFHEDVPDEAIVRLFEVLERADWHIFQILTKRPERMLQMYQDDLLSGSRNIWYGVSVENVETVKRCEIFKEMRGARDRSGKVGYAPIKWVSAEPLLEDITEAFSPYHHYVDWLVVGGESGPQARPMDIKWAYDLYIEYGMSLTYFFKQMGGRKGKGSTKLYSPYFLEAREFEVKHYPIDVEAWREYMIDLQESREYMESRGDI